MYVTVYTSFEDIPPPVSAALRYPVWSNYLTSIDWYECLYHTSFSRNEKLRVYVVTTDSKKPHLALFCVHRTDSRHLGALTNFYSTDFSPCEFGDTDEVNEAYRTLARFLLNEEPSWQSIELRYLPESSTLSNPLIQELATAGFYFYRYPLYENWHTAVSGVAFDDYYAGLSSRTRNTIRRKANKLANTGNVDIRFFEENDENLTTGIADYVEIYNNSWKNSEPYPDFIPTLARTCAKLGILMLGVLYLGNRPIAAQFWILTPVRAIIYKLAYVESYAPMSPGSVLSKALFERAFVKTAPSEIDYGIGDENYKREWMDSVRRVYSIHGYNKKTLSGLCSTIAYRARSILKSMLPATSEPSK